MARLAANLSRKASSSKKKKKSKRREESAFEVLPEDDDIEIGSDDQGTSSISDLRGASGRGVINNAPSGKRQGAI
eukprot:CAMPEP_0185028298 /NCGR_PEP_ID=MMETSP1103-20130426/13947_1 /TAXON_ID=36769 /ORGANISM="Paraphysomonas bandaiensis, Strain Caron Lab Isolate" /LENGTH=74 /DNA_ID=CAMNT_0027562673 /DNA_START=254 /DNA_END=478 /DNA_ORIENTATION=-